MTKKKQNRLDMINIMKYGLAIILLVYIVFILQMGSDSKTPFEDVLEAVVKAADTGNMEIKDTLALKKYYGLHTKDFEEIILYTARDAMGVEELLLLKVKKEEDMEEALSAVSGRIDTQRNNFEGYGEKQTALIRNAVTEQKGKYLLFVISPDADKIRKACLDAL